jgi:hypothetical protein
MAARVSFWTTQQAILSLALIDALNATMGLDPENGLGLIGHDQRYEGFLFPYEVGTKNYMRYLVFAAGKVGF